jgi:hypothetical protein
MVLGANKRQSHNMTMTLENPQNLQKPSREQVALDNGYIPDAEGVVTSPYGNIMSQFYPNKVARYKAFRFVDTKYTEKKPEEKKRPGTVVYVHRLVWTHFNGEIPKGKKVQHLDGNKDNNRLENLTLV